jgi:hypothetical protein
VARLVGVLLKEVHLPKETLKAVGDNLLNQTHGVLLKVVLKLEPKVDGDNLPNQTHGELLKVVPKAVGDNHSQEWVVLKPDGDNHSQVWEAHKVVGDNHSQVWAVHKLDLALKEDGVKVPLDNNQAGELKANSEDKVSVDNTMMMN